MKGAARLWLDSLQTAACVSLCARIKKCTYMVHVVMGLIYVHFEMVNTMRVGDEKIADYCFRTHALGSGVGYVRTPL